jgi:aerobic-type carbon monoxide dehydrogenase small subunit (CoxS/CutS family)
MSKVSFTVNGIARELELDTGTKLLDALSRALMQAAVRVPP